MAARAIERGAMGWLWWSGARRGGEPSSARRDHPSQGLAGEQVDVEVRHFLPAMRDLADRAHEPGDLLRARGGAEIGEGAVPAFRDHQHMRGRLRSDVVEGER